LDFYKFFVAVILGEIIYVILFSSVGLLFRDNWDTWINLINNYSILIGLLVVIFIVYKQLVKAPKPEVFD